MKFEPKTSTAEKIAAARGSLLLVLNGEPPAAEDLQREAEASDVILAADGGLHACLDADVPPDLVIGDLDSAENVAARVPPQSMGSVEVLRIEDQDSTDLEKALQLISEHATAPVALVVLGWAGGRTDHFLTNLGILLAAPPDWHVVLRRGSETLHRLLPNAPLELDGCAGDSVSVLPFGASCRGVRSSGLRWELEEVDLVAGEFVSQSNEAIDTRFTLSCQEGKAWVVHLEGGMNSASPDPE